MAKASGRPIVEKERKGKVKKAGKKPSALYEIAGDKIQRKNRFCPKCGKGTFLGQHKDRLVCGKCHYVEYLSKGKTEQKV